MRRTLLSAGVTVASLSALMLALSPPPGYGQRPGVPGSRGVPGIRGARGELGSRISGERTTRQVEVMRLQQSIDQLQSRLERLERRSASDSQFPAFTIEESKAELVYAEARLAETEERLDQGEASDLELAADRMKVARARSQLLLAKAAHTDGKLMLESELSHARRRLVRATADQQQMERLVAKGYASSDVLELQRFDVDLARNEVLRLQSRLELFNSLESGGSDAAPASQATEEGVPVEAAAVKTVPPEAGDGAEPVTDSNERP